MVSLGFLRWRPGAVVIGTIFGLHSYVTTSIFFICALLTFLTYSIVDPPMNCVSDNNIPEDYFNSYCWDSSNLSPVINKDRNGHGWPGIQEREGFNLQYYHYIPFFLIIHAILFYVPRYIWGLLERGRITSIVDSFRQDTNPDTRVPRLAKYLLDSRSNHSLYTACYMVCEILNFFNVIGNFLLIDLYMAGAFVNIGTSKLPGSTSQSAFIHDLKCTVERQGPSGSIIRHDTLCHVRVASFCEMMYLFLHCWLLVLVVLTALNIVWYLIIGLIRPFRKYYLMGRTGVYGNVINYNQLAQEFGMSDFFVFSLLGENMDTISFQEVLASISDFSNTVGEKTPLIKSD